LGRSAIKKKIPETVICVPESVVIDFSTLIQQLYVTLCMCCTVCVVQYVLYSMCCTVCVVQYFCPNLMAVGGYSLLPK